MSAALTMVTLAAGIGSRYGGLKQIDPIGPGGEAVLDYAVFDARRAGFDKFVFVIRKDIERDFRAAISHRFEKQVDVHYAFQERDMIPREFMACAGRVKPWGTGHAVLCAAPKVEGPFAVINADDFYGAESYGLLAESLRQPPAPGSIEAYAMVGFQLDRTLSEHGTVARGLCQTNSADQLVSVEELTAIEKRPDGVFNREPDGAFRPLSPQAIVSLNFWGFRPGLFEQLVRLFAIFLASKGQNNKAEFYLPAAISTLIEERRARVAVLRTPCHWFGITYREDRSIVIDNIRALTRAGRYPERLWN